MIVYDGRPALFQFLVEYRGGLKYKVNKVIITQLIVENKRTIFSDFEVGLARREFLTLTVRVHRKPLSFLLHIPRTASNNLDRP